MISFGAGRVNNGTIALFVSAVCSAVVRRRGVVANLAKKVIIITNCSLLITNLASCSTIDDDLSACANDYELDYELRLVTNMSTELKTQLNTATELRLANTLRNHLSGVFTDFAHDVDLSFYDTQGDSLRLQHDEHIMNANQASYALNLPKRQYMHLAVANIIDDPLIDLVNDERCHTSHLQQHSRDTIDSHTTGLFTARQPMEVLEGVDQNFNVHLYMANCAATLLIDTKGHDAEGIKVYTTGFATQFNICDSAYIFPEKSPIVRTNKVVDPDHANEIAYCSVTFPSREPSTTRSVIETEEPFIAVPGDESLWEMQVYVPKSDGSVTKNVLGIKAPLRAGQFKIIKCWIGDDGEIGTADSTVGVSVTLNWNDGYNNEIPL